jgi:NAD+ kinase
MKSSAPKILVLYKTSTYSYYFNSARRNTKITMPMKNKARFKRTHLQHSRTLQQVEEFLQKKGLRYCRSQRGRKIDFSRFEFIITVGGDGTFLEAARGCNKQVLLGINSDPKWSVGRFCGANDKTFPKIIGGLFAGKYKPQNLRRLKLEVAGRPMINIMNDVLICHANPAAMSRYLLCINGRREEQRSSGVWVATAAGSTGAIHSAGGKILTSFSDQWQYMPRELYYGSHVKHSFKGGILSSGQTLSVTSLMNSGVVYIDGCHLRYFLRFGETATIRESNQPLKVIMP